MRQRLDAMYVRAIDFFILIWNAYLNDIERRLLKAIFSTIVTTLFMTYVALRGAAGVGLAAYILRSYLARYIDHPVSLGVSAGAALGLFAQYLRPVTVKHENTYVGLPDDIDGDGGEDPDDGDDDDGDDEEPETLPAQTPPERTGITVN